MDQCFQLLLSRLIRGGLDYLALVIRLMSILPNGREERPATFRRSCMTIENIGKGDHPAVERASFILVLGDRRTAQIDAGKYSTSPRVGQNLSPHLPVGIGCGITSYGACGCGCLTTQLEFAGKEMLHAIV